jgi:KRAB domain-containing zinc finger protein
MKTHTSQKDFKCDECDSQFTRRASLNRHVRAAHAGQVIACPLCPAVFSYRSTLEDHKKAAHNEGKREFGCSLCGVQFAVKAYLSKHMVRIDYIFILSW